MKVLEENIAGSYHCLGKIFLAMLKKIYKKTIDKEGQDKSKPTDQINNSHKQSQKPKT